MSAKYNVDGSVGTFKIGSFKTGNYMHTCITCGRVFFADKQSLICLECVIDEIEKKRNKDETG